MRKSKKQLLRTLIACGLVVSVAAGGTVAYLTVVVKRFCNACG